MNGPIPDGYDLWCGEHGVSHGHCPYSCEHPQPFVRGDKLICGRCWFKHGEVTEMVPCTPEVCDEA